MKFSQIVSRGLGLALSFSLGISGFAQNNLEPRHVSNRGEVEVPKGMYEFITNAGERWLLPDGMTAPPEKEVVIRYWTPSRGDPKPTVRGRMGGHEVLNWALPAEEIFVDENLLDRLPGSFADLMRLEREANMHADESVDLKSLGKFSPAEGATFKLPYIPIPEDALEFAYVSKLVDPATERAAKFKFGGKTYFRFFVHPNIGEPYGDLIKKYGIVYHYLATTTSSPRSLIVIDPDRPKEVLWIKPSLHKKIDGSVRINHPKKVRRAVLNSEAMARIPQEALDQYNIGLMVEPVAITPKGKEAGTIFRTVSPELLEPAPGRSWLPAFSLKAPGKSGKPMVWEMIEKSEQKPADFITDRIVRPLLAAYLNLGVNEGLPGELHTQNFYYELNRKGLPTGRIILKDNDGFRFDVEMALRHGRDLGFLQGFENPFYYAKFSQTVGFGDEGAFLGSWYYKLIRNVNGFETLSGYLLTVLSEHDPKGKWDKAKIQRLFDVTAMAEVERITGVRVAPEDYGFGDDKGLNKALNAYRERLARDPPPGETVQKLNDDLQPLLRKEYERLIQGERASSQRRNLTDQSYFLLHKTRDGAYVIEARSARRMESSGNPTIGFAILEPGREPAAVKFLGKAKPHLRPGNCYTYAQDLLLKTYF